MQNFHPKTYIMKLRFLLPLFLLAPLSACAGHEYMDIHSSTGSLLRQYLLSGVRSITFDADDQMLVQLTDGTSSAFRLDGVSTLTFTDVLSPTAVRTPAAGQPALRWLGDAIVVSGLETGAARLSVCDASGHTLLRTVATEGQTVSLATLPRGVYIVRVSGMTMKVTR